MDSRLTHLTDWLKTHCQLSSFDLTLLKGDASFRRYFRVKCHDTSYVAMDAPPEKENVRPFISVAKALKNSGLAVPAIFAQDIDSGFLLLSDFGDRLYLNELNENTAEKLYDIALDALAILQKNDYQAPRFTEDFMLQECFLWKEWFMQKYLQSNFSHEKELTCCFEFITHSVAKQPYVFMHRDFHSANLMVLPDDGVGILDFQDAFFGPVTYDLVSLLRDCYISFPQKLIQTLALSYRDKINLHLSDDEFLFYFDMTALQRHLKALLTFSRKFCRDHDSRYLQHIPRTVNYIRETSIKYPECRILKNIFEDITPCAP